MKIDAAVVILTKNEGRVIRRCIESVADFVDVFVVDSSSEDETRAEAVHAGARVISFEWNGVYPKKKQWALENLPTSCEWVLFLDADEQMTKELSAEIGSALSTPAIEKFSGFDVELDYRFMGKRLKHGHKVFKRILIRRSESRFLPVDDLAVSNMWEVEGHYQPVVDGEVGKFKHPLVHDDVDPLYDYFARHNRYSDWEAYVANNPSSRMQAAQMRSMQGRLANGVPFKPLVFFIWSYILRLGFLDGRAGFDYAIAHAFYFWQINVKRREPFPAWSEE